ncbi:TonB-dependent receptor plug domain-containing protein [Desulfatitalea alkaliphila]|uniref:TonB-dependent receptor n=1 Tax=Desulfatitalea alkaliphila TaxID=2929485 RepID=A0AA41QZR4_9BACT|nr:TonB-dependent receptor [Desulfatitalea alkaliphila]MCJ8499383.1 TonB-dependent receptor [Desulfatitalea alkaliphila]
MALQILFRFLFLGLVALPLGVPALAADNRTPGPASPADDTLLMFVGERTPMLRIASRREQSAWQAPAIARVIERDELRERGAHTLSQALETVPGFLMAPREWGTLPYQRGIPNGTLFLHDTVPVQSEVNKALHHIDHALPLWSAKQIEIISGPGSVLWGPDAFAGIVNLVPLTGKDLQGVESGAFYGLPGDQHGAFVNAGYDGGLWDGFLSLSGRRGRHDSRARNIVRFTGPDGRPLPPEQRAGRDLPDDAEYLDIYGHFAHGGWLNLSGRLALNQTPYTMTAGNGAIAWGETRGTPFGFLKMEAKRDLDWRSALKLTAYYTHLAHEHEVIDRKRTLRESTGYGELVYDRTLFQGAGRFTGGLSHRHRTIRNAPIWTGYLPGYLASENPTFTPIVLETDFHSRMTSLFGQYMHTFGPVDLFAGLRHDMHANLADQTSVNAGIGWSPARSWRLKLQYGTAYRTPFSRQRHTGSHPDPEEIHSANLQLAWQPDQRLETSATGFFQRIDRHVLEDPYAGLSQPNRQEIYGVELEARIRPHKTLSLHAGLTWTANSGPDEKYRYLEAIVLEPDGTIRELYGENTYPYDLGADLLFTAGATWRPLNRLSLNLRTVHVAARHLILPRQEALGRTQAPAFWRLDAAAVIRDVLRPGMDLEIALRNFTDRRHPTPGTYDIFQSEPFTATFILRVRW